MVCLLKHGQFSWPTRGYVGSARHVRYDLIAAGSPRCLVWRWDLWPESAGLGRCLKLGLRWCQLFRKHLVGIAGFFIFLNMWCDMCGSLWRFPEMPVPPVNISMLNQPAIGGTPMYGTLPFGDFQVSGTNPQPLSAGHDRATTPLVRWPEKKRVGRFDSPVVWKRSLKIDRKRSFQI